MVYAANDSPFWPCPFQTDRHVVRTDRHDAGSCRLLLLDSDVRRVRLHGQRPPQRPHRVDLQERQRPGRLLRSKLGTRKLLGGSGGGVNSLELCPASLSVPWLLLLPVRTIFTMEGGDREFANFTLPTLKAFLEARSHNVSGNKQ